MPKQVGKWLGTIINTRNRTFSVPPEKVSSLGRHIRETLQQETVTPKNLAMLTATLSSMSLAIGPLVKLLTRSIYHQIATALSWYQPIILNRKTIADFEFWLQDIEQINGYTFKSHPTTALMVFTDASDGGYGGYGGFTVHKLQSLRCNTTKVHV